MGDNFILGGQREPVETLNLRPESPDRGTYAKKKSGGRAFQAEQTASTNAPLAEKSLVSSRNRKLTTVSRALMGKGRQCGLRSPKREARVSGTPQARG